MRPGPKTIQEARDWIIDEVFEHGDGLIRRRLASRLRYLREKYRWSRKRIEEVRQAVQEVLQLEERRAK